MRHIETKLRRIIRRQDQQIENDRLTILRQAQQLADANLERKRLKSVVLGLQERLEAVQQEDIHGYLDRIESRHW